MSLDVTLVSKKCQECGRSDEVYWGNITHNLAGMADAANIYKPLWRPEEIDITTAHELIPILESGLYKLKHDRSELIKLNPENGWGSYDGLVEFVMKYLNACREYPQATIKTCR